MKRAALLSLAAVSVVLACQSDRRLTSPPSAPLAAIQDGAHNGNIHFFFLPPLVPNPTTSGVFNPNLRPVVEICALKPDLSGCVDGPPFKRFGPGSDVQVDLTGQHYLANWNTSEPPALDVNTNYRIRVFDALGGTELGFADVNPVTPQELRNARTGDLIPLLDGRTLPIKFRIENGVLCQQTTDCVEQTVGAAGGNVITNTGFAAASFPQNALSQDVTVIIERVQQPCFSGFQLPPQEGVFQFQQFDGCYSFRTDPGPQQFPANALVRVEVCVELPMTDPRRSFLEIFKSDGGPATPLQGAKDQLINCTGFGPTLGSLSSNKLINLASAGWLQVLAKLGRLVQPRPLFAATAVIDDGLGGLTGSFSRIGWALPATIEIVEGNNQTAAPGATLPTNPKVKVMGTHPEKLAPRPISGFPVTFTVTGGGGSVGTPTMFTGTDGTASTSWTLGATSGVHTLAASAPATGSPATFTSFGAIRVAGFTTPRDRAPLLDPTGTAPTGDFGSSNIVNVLVDATKFGVGGVVSCPVQFSPFVTLIDQGSLVDGTGKRLVDVFFAGLTATDLTTTEANEMAAFLNAGGVLYVSGNTDTNEGPSYNPLFVALGVSDRYSTNTVFTGNFVQSSDPPNTTPITSGPFGAVGPLTHTPFRIILPSTMTGLATGFNSTSVILAEGAFGSGRLSATGDPLYFNFFTGTNDPDNQTYFLNLFAVGCR